MPSRATTQCAYCAAMFRPARAEPWRQADADARFKAAARFKALALADTAHKPGSIPTPVTIQATNREINRQRAEVYQTLRSMHTQNLALHKQFVGCQPRWSFTNGVAVSTKVAGRKLCLWVTACLVTPRPKLIALSANDVTNEAQREIFMLRLRPSPHVDAIKTLRIVLKALLRRYGLRCVLIEIETVKNGADND